MRALFSLLALLPVTLLQAAEIPLYPTGPSEDSAFLRFFNAGQTALELSAANGASLRLEGDVRASDFLTVPAGKPIKGTLKQANQAQQLDIGVAPGEFATVVGITSRRALSWSPCVKSRMISMHSRLHWRSTASMRAAPTPGCKQPGVISIFSRMLPMAPCSVVRLTR